MRKKINNGVEFGQNITSLVIIVLAITGIGLCTIPDSTSRDNRMTVSRENLGKRITLVGRVLHRKNGDQLIGDGFEVWLEHLRDFPAGYYSWDKKGQKVRVTGILTEDHALPVFIPREGEPIVQGIPVPEGTDLRKAGHRFVLRDVRWEIGPD